MITTAPVEQAMPSPPSLVCGTAEVDGPVLGGQLADDLAGGGVPGKLPGIAGSRTGPQVRWQLI